MRTGNKNYEAILAAAEQLFQRYGYDKTSVEDIAAGVGKSKTAVYYYFPGKQDILKAVLEKEFGEIRQAFETRTAGEITRDSLYEYLSERMHMFRKAMVYRQFLQLHYLCDNTEIVKLLESVRKPFDDMEKTYYSEVCSACVGNGVFDETIDPEVFANMLVVMLRGYELQFLNAENYPLLERTYQAGLRFLIYRK